MANRIKVLPSRMGGVFLCCVYGESVLFVICFHPYCWIYALKQLHTLYYTPPLKSTLYCSFSPSFPYLSQIHIYMNGKLIHKASDHNTKRCEVEKWVFLPHSDFERLKANPYQEHEAITAARDLM